MIKIQDFHRTEIFKSDYGTRAFLDNIFRRVFFDYQGKNSLGWVGLNSTVVGYWLFKVKNRSGVYCLSYRGILNKTNFWRNDIYDLQYFPHTNEEICDFFSIKENISILDPNFDFKIRNFQTSQELEQLFLTGRIIVTINHSEKCLIFSLWGPERWIEILKEGLSFRDERGTIHEIVSRGGIDRNIPAFEISYDFFDKLITTFCYQAQRPPSYVILKRRKSMAVEINSSGEINPSENTTTFENLISVCFEDDNHRSKIPNTLRKFFPIFEFKPKEDNHITQIIKEYNDKVIFNGLNPLWWNIDNLKTEGKIPAILFTGFLGSGKTTLINQIVEYEVLNKKKFIAVIQNEAGQKGIDGKLIDSAYTVETLDDGCICCGIRDKFVNSVIEICNTYKPDMLFIETSGMAEPSQIINDLLNISKIKLDSVITLVDCLNFDKIMKEFKEIALSQIKDANILVLTKTEKISDETYLRIKKFLSSINPKALIIESSKRISVPLLMSLPISFDLDSLKRVSKECSHISPELKVLSVKIKEEISYEFLVDFLKHHSERIFRIKGIVKLKEFEKPQILQSVGGNFELTNYHESIDEGILIFIGKNFSESEINKFFKSNMIPLNFHRRI